MQGIFLDNIIFNSYKNGTNYYTVENRYIESSIVLLGSSKSADLSSFFLDEESLQYKAIIFDEFAFHKHADTMWERVKNKNITKIVISSANGKSNLFYKLVSENCLPNYTMHWLHDPACDQKWYQQICLNNDPIWVEQYINIDYNYKYSIKRIAKSSNETSTRIKNPSTSIKKVVNKLYKSHKNPKNVTTPCDFSVAMAKYLTTTMTHQQLIRYKSLINNGLQPVQSLQQQEQTFSNHESNEVSQPIIAQPPIETESTNDNNKTIKAMITYKETMSATEPQIFDSLEVVITFIYFILDITVQEMILSCGMHNDTITKQPFYPLNLIKKPLSPKKLVSLINIFTHRRSA